MNPNAIIEGRRTKVPRALMLLAGLVAGLTLALLAFGAQSASAGSGGMGPGGAAAAARTRGAGSDRPLARPVRSAPARR